MNFHGDLVKPWLDWGHEWVITPHINPWMWSLIHVPILVNLWQQNGLAGEITGALLSIRGRCKLRLWACCISWVSLSAQLEKRTWRAARFRKISSTILNNIIWSSRLLFKLIYNHWTTKSRLCSHDCVCWWSRYEGICRHSHDHIQIAYKQLNYPTGAGRWRVNGLCYHW